jgi:hypothetical protein
MIKALMVITMVSGAQYTAKLPDMNTCMKEVAPVVSQNDVESAACIPRTNNSLDTNKLKQFFSLFSDLMNKMDDKRPNYYNPNHDTFPWWEQDR